MNQELTQRVIGAIVVTALAAIFIPMLFDDPVDNSGQVVSELTIPEQPVVIDAPATPVPTSVEDVTGTSEEGVQTGDAPDSTSSLSNQEMNAEPEGTSKEFGEEQEFEQPMGNAEEPEEPIVTETKIAPKAEKAPSAAKPKIVTAPPKPVNKATVTTTVKPAIGKPLVITETKPPVKTVKTDPALTRWYIQAGSFSKKENAVSLSESLRKQGMPVLLETIQIPEKGTLYRLRVGPELDKKRALAMKQKLDQQNIKSMLMAE